MPFNDPLRTLLAFPFSLLLLTACSSDERDKAPAGFIETVDFDATTAFNTYNETTFDTSTCQSLPLPAISGYFAAPDGRADAPGTRQGPLDLQSALSADSPLRPGDTLWLLPGRYHGAFTAEIHGTAAAPIEVRPLPGKRVILDNSGHLGSGLTVAYVGQWVDYHGLEVLSSSTARRSEEDSSSPGDLSTNGGVTLFAANTNLINFIIHDNIGGGISSWRTTNLDADSELYGNIIYNNGWTAPGRGHGHAIYIQNEDGFKKISSNIIFFGFATGIHAYTEGGYINNFDIEDNVWFMTGASDPRASQKKDNCLVGGFHPVRNLLLKGNLGYSENARGTRIGYGDSVTGQDALLEENYLSENLWVRGHWDQLQLRGNTLFRGLGDAYDSVADLGDNEIRNTPPGSGKKLFVHQNAHDPRRARIVIYNYDEDAKVSVDLSQLLVRGEAYRIHSVFGLFERALIEGIYDGSSIEIPMGSVRPPQPTGLEGLEESDDPHRRFGVFVITHGGCL